MRVSLLESRRDWRPTANRGDARACTGMPGPESTDDRWLGMAWRGDLTSEAAERKLPHNAFAESGQ